MSAVVAVKSLPTAFLRKNPKGHVPWSGMPGASAATNLAVSTPAWPPLWMCSMRRTAWTSRRHPTSLDWRRFALPVTIERVRPLARAKLGQ